MFVFPKCSIFDDISFILFPVDSWLSSKSAEMECWKCSFKEYGCDSTFACRFSSPFPCARPFAGKCLRDNCHRPKEWNRFKRTVSLTHNQPISSCSPSNNHFLFRNRKFQEQITSQYDDVGMRCERDAFDTLFDCAPDKLAVVKKVCSKLNDKWIFD